MRGISFHNTYLYSLYLLLFLPWFSENKKKYVSEIMRSEAGVEHLSDSCYDSAEGVVGIRDWIIDKLKFKFVRAKKRFAVLMCDNDQMFVIDNGNFCSVRKGKTTILSSFDKFNYLYYDMARLDSCYAIRSGGEIYVSKNSTDWTKVYDGYRGIKKSMVLVKRRESYFLLFIEYSPGFQRHNHCILEYSFETGETKIIKKFHNRLLEEYDNKSDFARHIHLIEQDPYTGDLYVGTGDFDFEPAVYVSKDLGETFVKIGGGTPTYRVLSFFFTHKSVFWSTDTPEPQYIYRLDRESGIIDGFPLINSALWCSVKTRYDNRDFYILSSNSEGALFDNNNRVYGILFENEVPVVYELFKRRSRTKYSQLFPCCCTGERVYLYDTDTMLTMEYKITGSL